MDALSGGKKEKREEDFSPMTGNSGQSVEKGEKKEGTPLRRGRERKESMTTAQGRERRVYRNGRLGISRLCAKERASAPDPCKREKEESDREERFRQTKIMAKINRGPLCKKRKKRLLFISLRREGEE